METAAVTQNKTSIRLTVDMLVNILFGVKGVTFISAKTTTIPSMTKGGIKHLNYMLDNVVKNSHIHCMLGYDYENRINKIAQKAWVADAMAAAIAAGVPESKAKDSIENLQKYSQTSLEDIKLKAEKRNWGEHMFSPFTGLISRIMLHHTKKDKQGILMPETYTRYMQVEILSAKTPVYRYKDTGKILSTVDLACVKKYLTKKQEQKILIRDYAVENINSIRINKKEYQIE